MSSSTSNSEPVQDSGGPDKSNASSRVSRRRIRLAGTAIVLLFFFVGIELVTRVVLVPKAADLCRLVDYHVRARKFVQEEGLKVALVGNSALDAGVDANILQEALVKSDIGRAIVQSFPVDDTRIVDWRYIINDLFWRGPNKPDLIVIPFHYRNLCDGQPVQIGRLSHYFSTPADWSDLLTQDMTSTSERIEVVLSSFWLSFAVRERIQHRISGALIPGYKDFTQEMRTIAREHVTKNLAEQPASDSYRSLERLLRCAREEHTPVWLVAFPPRDDKYLLSDKVVELVRREGMELLDMRSAEGIKPDMYKDWIHMTPTGKKAFSSVFAGELVRLIHKHRLSSSRESNGARERCAKQSEDIKVKT
jgi:hypothetical protein